MVGVEFIFWISCMSHGLSLAFAVAIITLLAIASKSTWQGMYSIITLVLLLSLLNVGCPDFVPWNAPFLQAVIRDFGSIGAYVSHYSMSAETNLKLAQLWSPNWSALENFWQTDHSLGSRLALENCITGKYLGMHVVQLAQICMCLCFCKQLSCTLVLDLIDFVPSVKYCGDIQVSYQLNSCLVLL